MRYKEYNVNRVLEQSIKLFWKNGFRGVSVNDIVEETRVNRFSLYHEFTNKEGILYNSLKLYRERFCDPHLKLLDQESSLEETLKTFFLNFFKSEDWKQGCYVIHIATELADEDERIKEEVASYLSELETAFTTLLKKHNKDNAKVLAKHLVGLYCTLMSFCLIHTPEQREKHITNGINVLLK